MAPSKAPAATTLKPLKQHDRAEKHHEAKLQTGEARRSGAALLVHVVAFGWYAYVWLWHFSPAAQHLPGSVGFGWFFKYLTFYTYTFQWIQLFICCCSDLAQGSKRQRLLDRLADDVSCAVFGLANVVTLMFYGLELATKDVEEAGLVDKPLWLGPSVHVLNSVVAWVDLLVSHPRTFSRRSMVLSLGLVCAYTVWILVCSHFNGVFPYPFLNKLPWPKGFCITADG
ncbi:hypothetical protein WJX73_001145 [Symbiochloris irregularis]|uniref:Uncharacterized protein n=1 Tax=Symbiochloris irregularis TaxID=706552 RepID=A0AAW1NY19_9CHLO